MEKEPQIQRKPVVPQEDVVFDMAAFQIRPKGPVARSLYPFYQAEDTVSVCIIADNPQFHDLPMERIAYDLYVIQDKSLTHTGKVLGVSASVVSAILERCNIPKRNVRDAQQTAKRIQRIREHWEDPGKKEETVSKIQAPVAKFNRTEGVRRHHQERAALYERNPELKDADIKSKMGQVFGCDPKRALYDLHVNQKLSIPKISQKFGLTRTTITSWLEFLGIERMKPDGPNTGNLQISPERAAIINKARQLELLGSLTELQRVVVESRYGENKKSMDRLAAERNIRRQAIQQAEQKAVKKLVQLITELGRN